MLYWGCEYACRCSITFRRQTSEKRLRKCPPPPPDLAHKSKPHFISRLPPLAHKIKAPMDLDDYFMMRTHGWDSGEYLQFTEYFNSAREAEYLCYTNYQEDDEEEEEQGDLYVTGDLYQNDVVTPAMIIVPNNRSKTKQRPAEAKESKKQCGYEPNELSDWRRHNAISSPVKAVKSVDEDLYRISPELLYKNVNKKWGLGFFASCCLVPTCSM